MRLGLRLLGGYFLITGIAAFFVLRVFMVEVRPSVREVMEDLMVDTAHLLAEWVQPELQALPEGGQLTGSAFARQVQSYALRPVSARIWGLNKQRLDYRVYVTDRRGRVVFDSMQGPQNALGQDFSNWRDVARTLRGEYGARATRDIEDDERSSVMYVAAPVLHDGRVIGVLTVAKPLSSVHAFIDRAEHELFFKGLWLLGASLVVGVLVTAWIVWSVRRLRRYAQRMQWGRHEAPPQLPGELGELAMAMADLRERLDGHEHVEEVVRAFTHELKSPLTAIRGAAEFLQDPLPDADRERFAVQVQDQAARLTTLVDRMLALSRLEHRRAQSSGKSSDPSRQGRVDLMTLWHEVRQSREARLSQAGLSLEERWAGQEGQEGQGAHHPGPCLLAADAESLGMALGSVLDNAIEFSPPGGVVSLSWEASQGAAGPGWCLSVRDQGPGVPPYAWARLGERFFSTPRPAGCVAQGARGSGLGLAIVKEALAWHGAVLRFEAASPGLKVVMHFPPDAVASPA